MNLSVHTSMYFCATLSLARARRRAVAPSRRDPRDDSRASAHDRLLPQRVGVPAQQLLAVNNHGPDPADGRGHGRDWLRGRRQGVVAPRRGPARLQPLHAGVDQCARASVSAEPAPTDDAPVSPEPRLNKDLPCHVSSGNALSGLLMYAMYLALFVHFFYQAYLAPGGKTKAE